MGAPSETAVRLCSLLEWVPSPGSVTLQGGPEPSRSRAVGKGQGEVVPGVRALGLRCSLEKGADSQPTKATHSLAFA